MSALVPEKFKFMPMFRHVFFQFLNLTGTVHNVKGQRLLLRIISKRESERERESVCVCVCARERERERERQKYTSKQKKNFFKI
jgi:hypothetical protein